MSVDINSLGYIPQGTTVIYTASWVSTSLLRTYSGVGVSNVSSIMPGFSAEVQNDSLVVNKYVDNSSALDANSSAVIIYLQVTADISGTLDDLQSILDGDLNDQFAGAEAGEQVSSSGITSYTLPSAFGGTSATTGAAQSQAPSGYLFGNSAVATGAQGAAAPSTSQQQQASGLSLPSLPSLNVSTELIIAVVVVVILLILLFYFAPEKGRTAIHAFT